ncbi:hypothetical protein BLNAU_24288 [Blattamonas nauphoetae]|uniref:Uncharacterized protein n=1 Tax=Blattamonas nauphoetae TaxID=2049346 RepID=A0ABQ9WMW9_9EUKA|nr:hypothetical protein BLNAU_24288 [Blattamonas nauphoetae]
MIAKQHGGNPIPPPPFLTRSMLSYARTMEIRDKSFRDIEKKDLSRTRIQILTTPTRVVDNCIYGKTRSSSSSESCSETVKIYFTKTELDKYKIQGDMEGNEYLFTCTFIEFSRRNLDAQFQLCGPISTGFRDYNPLWTYPRILHTFGQSVFDLQANQYENIWRMKTEFSMICRLGQQHRPNYPPNGIEPSLFKHQFDVVIRFPNLPQTFQGNEHPRVLTLAPQANMTDGTGPEISKYAGILNQRVLEVIEFNIEIIVSPIFRDDECHYFLLRDIRTVFEPGARLNSRKA